MAYKTIPDRTTPTPKPLPATMAEAEPYEVYEFGPGEIPYWLDENRTMLCLVDGLVAVSQMKQFEIRPTKHRGRLAGIVVDDGEVGWCLTYRSDLRRIAFQRYRDTLTTPTGCARKVASDGYD